MNFAHYYNILQQIEKPTFVFNRFDNQEITKKYLEKLDEYLIKYNEHQEIKRKIFNLVVEYFIWLWRSEYLVNNFIKIHDLPNFYLLHSNVILKNREYNKAINTIAIIENCNIKNLIDVYKTVIKDITTNNTMILEFIYIAKLSNNNCYFNITTTEKDYFILEIIAVIHKVIA